MFERLPLTSLKAFEAVARRGSAVYAASELFVTPGAVTRQIRELEEQVGARLFDRSPDGWKPTALGESLAKAVNASLSTMKVALEELATPPSPVLRIGCPRSFATYVLAPRLHTFLEGRTACRIVIDGDRQKEAPAAGELDLVIRYGIPEAAPRMRMSVLAASQVFPVCAPRLAERFGDLKRDPWPDIPVLSFLSVDYWTYWCAATDTPAPSDARRIFFSESSMLFEAAAAGAGVAIGHSQTIRAMMAEGRLVQLGEALVDERRYYVLTPENAHPFAQDFVRWLEEVVD